MGKRQYNTYLNIIICIIYYFVTCIFPLKMKNNPKNKKTICDDELTKYFF